MTRLAFCALLPLLLVGCGPSATVAPTTSATPAPAVGPTIIIVVATPTVSAPGVPGTVAGPTSSIGAKLNQQEQLWVISTSKALSKMIDAANTVKGSDTNSVVDARALLSQAQADYNSTVVPPAFAQADFYARRALYEEDRALTSLDMGIQTRNTALIDEAIPHSDNAINFSRKASAEIKSVADSR